MNWINLALLGAITLGLVNIFDSHLISRRMPSLRVFALLFSFIALVYGLILLRLFPLPEGISLSVLILAVISSIFRVVAVLGMLYVFKREEVSRVVPVVYTYPIFVAIMAVPLLEESLYYLEWLAIITVVAGAVLISIRRSESGSRAWLGRPFFLLFGASALSLVACRC